MNGEFLRQGSLSPKIEPITRYFLAFEGVRTEYQYFIGIRNNQETLGISALTDITLLQRHETKKHISNPARFLPQVIQSLEEYKTGSYSVDWFVDHAIDWLIMNNYFPRKTSKKYKMRGFLLDGLEEKGYASNDIVTDWDAVTQVLHDCLINLYCINISGESLKLFRTYLKKQSITYNPRYDKMCIIIDRDPKSFTCTQYDTVLTLCKDNKISLYLSNPCFEFWLLLHFPVINTLDPEMLLENKKISRSKRYLEEELQKINPQFRKNNLPFEMFSDKIDTAIQNETKFCEDLDRLKTELGSNVGLLLSELKSASKIVD